MAVHILLLVVLSRDCLVDYLFHQASNVRGILPVLNCVARTTPYTTPHCTMINSQMADNDT